MWTPQERQAAQQIATDITKRFRACQTPSAQQALQEELRQQAREAIGADELQRRIASGAHSELETIMMVVVEHRLSQRLDTDDPS